MFRLFSPLVAAFVIFTVTTGFAQTIGTGLSEEALRAFVRKNYDPTSVYSYDTARDTMYGAVDLKNGFVTCVYSGLQIAYQKADGDPSTVVFQGGAGINAEHSWPQSFFNEASPMVSDLHHLFPTWVQVNGDRSNHPFAEIDDNQTAFWYYNGTKTANKPGAGVIDLYSEFYNSTFEPREDHKGNLARAMFYFWTVYRDTAAIVNDATDNAAFFNGMKTTLKTWHYADPPDAAEIARTQKIATYQGNVNPFVMDTTLVRRIYFYAGDPEPEPEPDNTARPDSVYAGQIIISQYYEGTSNNKFIEITNIGRQPVNFDNDSLFLCLWANPSGSVAGVAPGASQRLTGTLAAGASQLFRHTSAATPAYAVSGGTVSGVCSFNGNDPVAISRKNNTLAFANRVDFFGNATGAVFAADISYYRKNTVVKANPSWDISEWTSIAYATVDAASAATSPYLGFHDAPSVYVFGGSAGWRLLSLPASTSPAAFLAPLWTQGATGADVSHGTANVLQWNPASASFQAVADLNQPLTRGTGLAVFFFDDADNNGQSDAFPRILGHAKETDASTYPLSLSNAHEGWNLVGNPFSQAIQWNHSGVVKSALSGSYWVWNAAQNAYGVWNGATGTNGQNGIIGAGQAFWVKSSGTSPSLTLGESAKNGERGLYKTTPVEEIRLATGNGTEAVLQFHPEASFFDDDFDAAWQPPLSQVFQAVYLVDGAQHKSVIQALPPLKGTFDVHAEVATTDGSEPELHFRHVPDGYSASIERVAAENAAKISLPVTASALTARKATFIIRLVPKSVDQQDSFSLHVYPTPFNNATMINLAIPHLSRVRMTVVDMTGRVVKVLRNETMQPGIQNIVFDAGGLASGMYLVHVLTEKTTLVKKITLLK
jgi:endonuclease I